jgi:hypothetical protein
MGQDIPQHPFRECAPMTAAGPTRTSSLGAARPLPPSADIGPGGSPLVKLGNDRRPEQQKAPDRAKATRRQPPSFSRGETTAAAVAILPRLKDGRAYREAWVTHEPRCSRIGPSPRFANIAAPSSSTEKLHVTTYHP